MGNEKNTQRDLFNQENSSLYARTKASSSFLSRIWGYEKTILLIFLFLITGIISFSLGVEKGKKIVLQNTNLKLDFALDKQSSLTKVTLNRKTSIAQSKAAFIPVNTQSFVGKNSIEKQVQPNQNIKEDSRKQAKPDDYNQYTIQLASYKVKAQAQSEIAKLKKRGFLPIILSKSGYNVVCVGNFPNKQTAQSYLSKLSKVYKGCFIRRL